MAANLTPPWILAKNATMSRARPSKGISIMPLIACSSNPQTPSKGLVSPSILSLLTMPPSSTYLARPKTAQAIIAAWISTSVAMT
jgi:hypothetical protein